MWWGGGSIRGKLFFLVFLLLRLGDIRVVELCRLGFNFLLRIVWLRVWGLCLSCIGCGFIRLGIEFWRCFLGFIGVGCFRVICCWCQSRYVLYFLKGVFIWLYGWLVLAWVVWVICTNRWWSVFIWFDCFGWLASCCLGWWWCMQ